MATQNKATPRRIWKRSASRDTNVDVEAQRRSWTLAVIFVVLWALGLVSSYTLGGYIHILLVLAAVVILMGLVGGR